MHLFIVQDGHIMLPLFRQWRQSLVSMLQYVTTSGNHCHMASYHQACISLEIFHFNVEHHIAIEKSEKFEAFTPPGNMKCDLYIFHLFSYDIMTIGISFLLVDDNSLFNCLRQLVPKLMGSLKVSSTVPHHSCIIVYFLDEPTN